MTNTWLVVITVILAVNVGVFLVAVWAGHGR
jgi:hypothetical protein